MKIIQIFLIQLFINFIEQSDECELTVHKLELVFELLKCISSRSLTVYFLELFRTFFSVCYRIQLSMINILLNRLCAPCTIIRTTERSAN